MGFRSTFVTDDEGARITWPEWLVEKYSPGVRFPESRQGPLSSAWEAKHYDALSGLADDIRKAINWGNLPEIKPFNMLWLHECGGITKVEIRPDSLRYAGLIRGDWTATDEVIHEYCSNCDPVPTERVVRAE